MQTPAAFAILALTLAASLGGLYARPAIIERNLFRPYWLLRKQEYATVITSGFVHADLTHLLFNMITFYFFAFPMERVLGTPRFVLLYLAGLLVSHFGTWHKQRDNPQYASLGASGAISAVLFAFIVYFPTQSLFIIPIPVPIPAPLFAIAYVAYSWYSARNPHGRINHDAHLGGALAGLAFVLLTDPGAYRGLLQSLGV
ncbi:MAG TPA: rhomboid family intramembrane serine protease [Steroidobacteraceae bacterium]|nr:rhomboid family intramembrane serine protease [Steroidobacteraceae bacterium]